MKFLSGLLLTLLYIVFLPLVIIGTLIQAYAEFVVSRRYGASATAVEIITYRLLLHELRTREDHAAKALAKALPNVSYWGCWLFLIPMIIVNRLFGTVPLVAMPEKGKESLKNFITPRTAFIDRHLMDHIAAVDQVVIMGAGYDTRAYGLLRGADVTIFELDEANTQRLKLAALDRAVIERGDVTYVEVDFDHESWDEKLVQSGFDPSKSTLFLLEGVTNYLEKDAALETLKTVVRIGGPGGRIILDLYDQSMMDSFNSGAARVFKYTNESFKFGLNMAADPELAVAEIIESAGLKCLQIQVFGHKRKNKSAFMAMVLAGPA